MPGLLHWEFWQGLTVRLQCSLYRWWIPETLSVNGFQLCYMCIALIKFVKCEEDYPVSRESCASKRRTGLLFRVYIPPFINSDLRFYGARSKFLKNLGDVRRAIHSCDKKRYRAYWRFLYSAAFKSTEDTPRYGVTLPALYSSTSLSRFEKVFGSIGTYERIQCPKFGRERDTYCLEYCTFIPYWDILCFATVIRYVSPVVFLKNYSWNQFI